MSGHDHYDDDDEKDGSKPKKFDEFDCGSCNANNPWPDGFKDGDEVICHYCGTSFITRISDEGKLKLREI